MLRFVLLNYPDGKLSFKLGIATIEVGRDQSRLDPTFKSIYDNLEAKAYMVYKKATGEDLIPSEFNGIISGGADIKHCLDDLTEAAIDIRLNLLNVDPKNEQIDNSVCDIT